jgi:hypothetical protein
MVKVKELFQNRNQFDANEIGHIAQFIHDAFYFKNDDWELSLETRISMLKGYIEVLRQLLFSDLLQNDSKKLMVVDFMDKLTNQKELFENALMSKDELEKLSEIADQFSKKTKAPIGI